MPTRGLKKGLKIGRALKSAARLPARVSGGNGSGRNAFTPMPGEAPVVILRLQVLGCKEILAKDRGRHSDPYVTSSTSHCLLYLCQHFRSD